MALGPKPFLSALPFPDFVEASFGMARGLDYSSSAPFFPPLVEFEGAPPVLLD